MANSEFDPDTTKIQQVFKGLKIYSRIGSGGQKIVYKATHARHGTVALKLIRPGSSKAKARILREIDASARLIGPGFSKIFDFGEIEVESANVLYMFEEFLDGQTLRELLSASKKIDLSETLRITRKLLETLVKVDEANIVHRDIKPENIFITTDNRIILIDFGIARHLALRSLTHDYDLLGPLTPGYAAPEQIKNEKRKISARTDLLLLGIVIYECLAGCNPFTKDCSDAREALNRNLNLNPKPLTALGFKRDISDFVETCLQKRASRRYPNPIEALRLVENM